MKVRVGVFFGGKTVEHEVSVITAMQAIAALDREKYQVVPVYITKDSRFFTGEHLAELDSFRDIPAALAKAERVLPVREGKAVRLVRYPARRFGSNTVGEIDVALPLGHGSHVEDGCLQGLLEYLDIPYAGCDVTASACGMDKWAMKALFLAAGLPALPGVKCGRTQYYRDPEAERERISALPYPLVVKPYNLGSSVGICLVRDESELDGALETVFALSDAALCEPQVRNLREINCAVLGDRESARPSVCEEPFGGDFLSYQDKYQSGGKGAKAGGAPGDKAGMASLARKVPADIPDELRNRVQDLAVRAFQAIGAEGVARVDFLLDGQTGELYVNEINTIPGSLSFYLWEPAGLSYPALLDELIALALKRDRGRQGLNFSFETNLLATVKLGGGSKTNPTR